MCACICSLSYRACNAYGPYFYLWFTPFYIPFSNMSSASYSQTFPLHPILTLLVCTLISHILSEVSSQNFPLLSILNHLPRILFSNTNSVSLSQTTPQYTIQKTSNYHTLKHLSILKHTPTILSTNISSLSYSQTSICTLFSNTYAVSHSQTSPHYPNLKHLGTLCTYNPLGMPFSDINNLQTNNYNQQLHIRV